MICYKDMTFCSYYNGCDEEDCDRKLTPEVEAAAEKFGLPICQFLNKPDCWVSSVKAWG